MDPLSLVASIITNAGVGGTATAAIRKLALVNDAPEIVLALNNEISDLNLTLLTVQEILKKDQSFVSSFGDPSWQVQAHERVSSSLRQTQDTVARLALLHNRLEKYTLEPTTLKKITWLREQKYLRQMQRDLRSSRQKLIGALGMFSASNLLTLHERIQLTQSKIEQGSQSMQSQIEQRIQLTHSEIKQGLQSTQNKVEQVMDFQSLNQQLLTAQDLRVVEHERAVRQGATQAIAFQEDMRLRLDSIEARHRRESLDSIAELPGLPQIVGQNVRISASFPHRRCRRDCECGCHRRYQLSLRSPRVLRTIIGTIFAGYTGTSNFDEGCQHQPACLQARGRIAILYVFPAWFVARAITIALSYFSTCGPQLNIRMINVVHHASQVLLHAENGNVEGLKNVLRRGFGSSTDVDASGVSPLFLAVQNHHIEICRILLLEGSNPYDKNSFGLNAFDAALSSILSKSGDVSSRKALRELLPIDEALDEAKLSLLHRTILSLSPIDVEQLIKELPKSALNIGDIRGRTPLWWAARRGNSRIVSLLLSHGVDELRADSLQINPLNAAIHSRNSRCIRQLIDFSCPDADGWLPTHLACQYGVDLDTFKMIFSKSPDINASTWTGETLLAVASYHNKLELAKWLIQQGASLEITNSDGRSSLHLAIYSKSTQTLRLLLQHRADHTIKTSANETLLHYAAQYGDIACLDVLSTFQLDGININDRVEGVSSIRISNKVKGLTALEIAEQVREADDEWLAAFRELVRRVESPERNITVGAFLDEDEVFEDAIEVQE